jgi:hypothetical protein
MQSGIRKIDCLLYRYALVAEFNYPQIGGNVNLLSAIVIGISRTMTEYIEGSLR